MDDNVKYVVSRMASECGLSEEVMYAAIQETICTSERENICQFSVEEFISHIDGLIKRGCSN